MRSKRVRAAAVGAVVVCSVAGVAAFDALGGAQTVGTEPIVQAGVDSSPALSDDGSVVVFQSDVDDGAGELEASIVLVDRTDPAAPVTTTLTGAGEFGVRPGVSGDGCTVVWSIDATDPPPGPNDRLVVFDRCDADGNPVDPGVRTVVAGIAEVDASDQLGAPAVSADGTTIAVSTGEEVVILNEAGGAFTLAAAVDGPDAPAPGRVTDDHVDLSDDGAVVVFSAGPDADDTDRDVLRFRDGVAAVLVEDAAHPDLSGDGVVLTYEAAGRVLAVAVPETGAITAEAVDLAAGARPSLSADGNHIVFDTTDGVAIHSWIGSDARPFSSVDDRAVAGVSSVTRSGPAIDRLGRLVATDTPFADGDPETDVSLTRFEDGARFGAESYDLGSGEVGDVLTTTLDLTNDGPASFVVEEITTEGSFAADADACLGVLRAGTTCSFDVSFTIEAAEDAFSDVTVTGSVAGADPVVTEVRALGTAPTTTTSTTTSTTPTSTSSTTTSTTTTTTAGTTTGGSSTGGTSTTTGGTSTTRGGTSTTRGGTSSTSGGGTTRTTTTTTTTLPPGSGLVVSPPSFEFAPTIIDAGRRTGAIEVVNSAADAATVDSVALDGDAAFTIAADGCSGVVLGEGERCTITVDFAPTIEGTATSQLIAVAAGGRELTASLSGTGARPPQLSVVPESARSGQVITVLGIGFPTGITVELSAGGTPVSAVVDDSGSFAQPVVILPHTPGGPLDIVATGQEDLFADVVTEVLIRASSDRMNPAVRDGLGVHLGS